MEFAVKRFVLFQGGGALKAFCDVMVDQTFLIKGIRVVEGNQGLFVSMPRQLASNGKWYDSVVALDPDARGRLHEMVLETFEQCERRMSAVSPVPTAS